MALRIRWSSEITVPGGPTLSFSRAISVDGTDLMTAHLEPGESAAVDVQPSAAEQVRVLMVTSTAYGEDLTYRVGSSTQDVALDSPQVFAGAGMIGRLPTDPQTLTFTNGLAEAATVTILAGRTIA